MILFMVGCLCIPGHTLAKDSTSCSVLGDDFRELVSYIDKMPTELQQEVLKRSSSSVINNITRTLFIEENQSVTLRKYSNVNAVAYSPDGTTIAVGAGSSVILLNAKTGEQVKILGSHQNRIASVVYSAKGNLLVSSAEDNSIKLWDPIRGSEVKMAKNYCRGYAMPVAISPDEKKLAFVDDYAIHIWDIEKGEVVRNLGERVIVQALDFHPLESSLAIGTSNGKIILWNFEKQVKRELYGHRMNINSLKYRPDGKQLAVGDRDNYVRLWNLDSANGAVNSKELLIPKPREFYTSGVAEVVYTTDGKQLFAGLANDHMVKVWDVETGKEIKSLSIPLFVKDMLTSDTLTSISVHPQGRRVVIGSWKGCVQVFPDILTLNQLEQILGGQKGNGFDVGQAFLLHVLDKIHVPGRAIDLDQLELDMKKWFAEKPCSKILDLVDSYDRFEDRLKAIVQKTYLVKVTQKSM